VLPERGGDLEVELVERDHPLDVLRPGQIADCVDHVLAPLEIRHVEDLVDAVARPVCIPQLLACEEKDAAAEALAFADELLPLEVAGEAENGYGSIVGHGADG